MYIPKSILITGKELEECADVPPFNQYENESEILFDAGQKMCITSAESKDGILYITVLIK